MATSYVQTDFEQKFNTLRGVERQQKRMKKLKDLIDTYIRENIISISVWENIISISIWGNIIGNYVYVSSIDYIPESITDFSCGNIVDTSPFSILGEILDESIYGENI